MQPLPPQIKAAGVSLVNEGNFQAGRCLGDLLALKKKKEMLVTRFEHETEFLDMN